MQREEGVRVRVVEGTQSKASGVQRGSGQDDMRVMLPRNEAWPRRYTLDAGFCQGRT